MAVVIYAPTEKRTSPALIPTVIDLSPRNERLRASTVPEDVRYVLLLAYNPTVWLVWLKLAEAVTVCDPAMPKETLLEFEKMTVPVDTDCVPALKPIPDVMTVAVIVWPFTPNDTPFEFEKTTVPDDTSVVPALMALSAVCPGDVALA
jgi:hypothetical protein